jgi:predicted nucleic acid-binding protein
MIYADSSFVVKLASSEEEASYEAVAEFRRLGRPRLAYTIFHWLEITNAFHLRMHYARKTLPSSKRTEELRRIGAGLSRLNAMKERNAFAPVKVEWEDVMELAQSFSLKHSAASGARALDLIHVAGARLGKAELFLTCDRRQAVVAKAEGLNLVYIGHEEQGI